jgi:hypothetical protein
MIQSWHIPDADGVWNVGGPETLICSHISFYVEFTDTYNREITNLQLCFC